MGISTVWDLKNYDPMSIRQKFSIIEAKIVRELCGESCLEIDEVQKKK